MTAAASRVPLSVLDLVPRSEGMTPAEAIAASRTYAERLDELGYHRLWIAEHHNTGTFMSSATALLIAHLGHDTRRIRLGSGGVMLPNHSPLMVAEYYGTLATLFPDRIDLGLGRAPGTDPMTASALARRSAGLEDVASDVAMLARWLGGEGAALGARFYFSPQHHAPGVIAALQEALRSGVAQLHRLATHESVPTTQSQPHQAGAQADDDL